MSSIKIIIASQACHINLYKNLNSKISKCCASIYFNKQCLKIDGCIIYRLLLDTVTFQKTHLYEM